MPFKMTVSTAKKADTKIFLEHVPVTLKQHHLKYILAKANITNASGLRQETGNPSRWTCWVATPEEDIVHTIRLQNPVKGDRKITPDITVRIQGRKLRCKYCGQDDHFASRCQSKETPPERDYRPRNEEERLAAARQLLATADSAPPDGVRQSVQGNSHPPTPPRPTSNNEISAAAPIPQRQLHLSLHERRRNLRALGEEIKRIRDEQDARFAEEILNIDEAEAEEARLVQQRIDEQKARERREETLAEQRRQEMQDRQQRSIENRKTQVVWDEIGNGMISTNNRFTALESVDENGLPIESSSERENDEEASGDENGRRN